MGYVPAKKLKDKETKKTEFKSDADTYTHILMKKKISLGWNAITNLTANGNLETIIEHTKGLNVISPTWYSMSDNKDNLRSYIRTCMYHHSFLTSVFTYTYLLCLYNLAS